jgi:hypothetical protein
MRRPDLKEGDCFAQEEEATAAAAAAGKEAAAAKAVLDGLKADIDTFVARHDAYAGELTEAEAALEASPRLACLGLPSGSGWLSACLPCLRFSASGLASGSGCLSGCLSVCLSVRPRVLPSGSPSGAGWPRMPPTGMQRVACAAALEPCRCHQATVPACSSAGLLAFGFMSASCPRCLSFFWGGGHPTSTARALSERKRHRFQAVEKSVAHYEKEIQRVQTEKGSLVQALEKKEAALCQAKEQASQVRALSRQGGARVRFSVWTRGSACACARAFLQGHGCWAWVLCRFLTAAGVTGAGPPFGGCAWMAPSAPLISIQ